MSEKLERLVIGNMASSRMIVLRLKDMGAQIAVSDRTSGPCMRESINSRPEGGSESGARSSKDQLPSAERVLFKTQLDILDEGDAIEDWVRALY